MKFVIDNVSTKGERLGKLSGFKGFPNMIYETPMVILATESGSLPNISEDNLESLLNGIAEHNKLENSSKPDAAQRTVKSTCPTVPILGYSIQDFIHKLTSITKFNKGIAGISAMQDFPSIGTVLSPLRNSGAYNKGGNYIGLQTIAANYNVDPDKFLEAASAYSCCVTEALHDSNTPLNCSKKRIAKSSANTMSFVTDCCEKNSASNDKKLLLLPLNGGWKPADRSYYSKKLKEYMDTEDSVKESVAGFSLLGFHNNGSDAENLADEDCLEQCVQSSLSPLPSSLPRFAFGGYSPRTLLSLVGMGLDVFDSSYASMAADRGVALLLNRSEDAKYNCDQDEEPVVEKNEGERKENEEKSAKRFKSDEKLDKVILSKQEKKETERKQKCEKVERPHEMNLHLPKYLHSHAVLQEGCCCYTCSKGYTRSYMHHLANSNEMELEVLLSMHNLHEWICFFGRIREAIATDSFDSLKNAMNLSGQTATP